MPLSLTVLHGGVVAVCVGERCIARPSTSRHPLRVDKKDLQDRFAQLNTWSRGDQRAPHKPLLILYALGQLLAGKRRLIFFSDLEAPLTELLREFGPSRKSYHPEYPFARLVADGVWELVNADAAMPRKGHTDPKKSELRRLGVEGGFPSDVFSTLKSHPDLCISLAHQVLDAHFPDTMHQDLLDAVGIPSNISAANRGACRTRDPEFRERVLRAYQYRCAVCALDIRMGAKSIGVEAAHIKWHNAGGPDTESNGLALCSLHHKLLDRGVFTVTPEAKIVISEQAVGTGGFDNWVLGFHGKAISRPIRDEYRPGSDYLAWHQREVFRAPGRQLT